MHGARGGAPERKRNGNYRHGGRSKESRLLEAHQIAEIILKPRATHSCIQALTILGRWAMLTGGRSVTR